MRCGLVSQFSPEQPQAYGDCEPNESGEKEDDPGVGSGKPDPEDKCKARESDASHGCSIGVDGGDGATAIGAVVTGAGFVLFLVSFDKAGTSGKDGWEGEEEAAHNGAAALSDEAGGDADGSAEDKANDPLMWLDSFDCREASADNHRGYLMASQNANVTTNQIGRSDRVAVRARGLKRQSSQVVEAA